MVPHTLLKNGWMLMQPYLYALYIEIVHRPSCVARPLKEHFHCLFFVQAVSRCIYSYILYTAKYSNLISALKLRLSRLERYTGCVCFKTGQMK